MSIRKIIGCIAITMLMMPLLKAQNIDQAKQLIENERYHSAESVLEKNINSGQAEPELNYLLVKTYLEQDKIDEAGNYVTKYMQSALSESIDPLNRIACARYLLNAGKKQAAEDIFTALYNEKKNQKNPAVMLAMAEVAVEEKEGNANMALEWLEKAEKKDKHNPDIYITQGLAYRKLGDASNAYIAYEKAIKEDPDNARAQYLMGKIFRSQNNPAIYMEYFNKAYQLDPTYAPVLEELYKHYYYRDLKLARKYLEEYIANTDYDLKNDYYMTDILYLNGEYNEAIQSAAAIIEKQKEKSQSRLYRLMAYSYAKMGDSAKAQENIETFFTKEDPKEIIAADYVLRAQLSEKMEGREAAAIMYYTKAAELDSVTDNKAGYAAAIAALAKKTGDNSTQALWLGKLYGWKKNTNNVDLFNWGIAHYTANEFNKADSVFALYTERYPKDIYGYYWRAQSTASIDTAMTEGLAIPHYKKVVEIGEADTEANKKMLLKAYGYLGGYEANVTKDYPASVAWFEKYLELDEDNADVAGYIETLNKWIADKDKEAGKEADNETNKMDKAEGQNK